LTADPTGNRLALGRRGTWLRWTWPVLLLVAAWLIAPLRARRDYPGMPCTAGVDTGLQRISYTVAFIPATLLLLILTGLAVSAARRKKRAWAVGISAAGAVIAAFYLVFAGVSVGRDEEAVPCPAPTAEFKPLHCWKSGGSYEMNALGRRPQNAEAAVAFGRSLAAQKQDAALYEAFLLDTEDPAVADYSNARIFVLQRANLTGFGDLCLSERQARLSAVQTHRIGFYRYSQRQRPPVDAFFLVDRVQGNPEVQFEVVDFLQGQFLPYRQPDDLQAAESDYLDRVAASLRTLNDDLDRQIRSGAPPSVLTAMRRDFERITPDLANAPPRLKLYRDSRLERFLKNFEQIMTAEEDAASGQPGRVHSAAYEQHRRYYYQEPTVTRLIGFLYLQEPDKSFTDDELSTVNWAVF
jgi:hypothetical protein